MPVILAEDAGAVFGSKALSRLERTKQKKRECYAPYFEPLPSI